VTAARVTGAALAVLDVAQIRPNPANRPEQSGQADMDDLVASIRALGILEPVIVRPNGPGRYVLMAGERRWTAAGQAGKRQIPAMVWHGVAKPRLADLLVILTENWQRVPMSAVEIARMLGELNTTWGMRVAEIAQLMGRKPGTVYWYLELLKADETTLARLADPDDPLTSGQVRAAIRAQTAPPPGHRTRPPVAGRAASRIRKAKPARAASYYNATHRAAPAVHHLCARRRPPGRAAHRQDRVRPLLGPGHRPGRRRRLARPRQHLARHRRLNRRYRGRPRTGHPEMGRSLRRRRHGVVVSRPRHAPGTGLRPAADPAG
jgi:ParB/RepB/Spo0J family partition protein